MKTKSIESVPTGQDIVGSEIQSLRNEISEIKGKQDASTAILATYPQPFSPFTVAYDPSKGRLFAYMPFTGIQDLDSLLIVVVRASDATSDASIFNNKLEDEWADIDQTEKEGNLIQRKFGTRLDYNETYYIWRLIGFVQGGGKLKNPETAPVFTDPPLATFTTPVKFDVPSKPELGLIIENKLDDTTKAFDAFVVVVVYAPATGNPVAYTGNATINGTTTVTGSVSFVGQVAIGQLITINNETRMVTNIVSTTITVDYRFRTNFTGAMSISTLFTWAEKEIETVIPKFQLLGEDSPIHPHAKIDGSNANQKFVKIRVPGFVAARQYQWTRNVLAGQGEDSNNTPVTPVTFIAGGFTDATAGIPELSGLAYRYLATEPYNDKQRHVVVVGTQPNPPVALDRAELRLFAKGAGTVSVANLSNQINGVGTTFSTDLVIGYQVIVGAQTFTVQSITNDFQAIATANSNTTLGGQDYYFSQRVKDEVDLRRAKFHPPTGGAWPGDGIVWGDKKTNKLLQQIFRTTIFAQNGQTRNLDDNFTTGAIDDGATQPLALAFPAAPTGSNNTVDGDPEKALAHIALTLATGNGQTFAQNFNSQLEIVMIRRNAANSADVGKEFSEIKVLSTADLATNSCVHEFYLRMGQKFRITKVIARNGDKRAETTGFSDFTAGGVLTVDPADSKIVPAPAIVSITRTDLDDNKSDDITFSLTQDTIDIVLFKKLVIEKNINGSGWRGHTEIGLKAEDTLYLSNTASISKTVSIPRRAGKNAQYRLTAIAVGGRASAPTTSGLQGATTADVTPDTGLVTLAFNPTLTFKRGKLTAKQKMLNATNILTIQTVELCITDGTDSLNLDDLDSNTKVSGNVFYYLTDKGTHHVITISKQQLQTIFGSLAQLKCRLRFTNVFGQTLSNFSPLLNSLESQNDYSPRAGYNNEIWNGDFTFDNTLSPTALGNWQQYAPSDGGFSNINTTSASARWDRDNHLYFWRINDATSANKRFLVQNLFKVIVPSDYKSLSFFLSSNGSLSADVDVFLASLFILTGVVSIANGNNVLTGQSGVAQFLTELRPGAEVGVNGEIHVIQSITDNEHAVMTTVASSTASGQMCFAAVPQSEIVSITGKTYNTAETYIEVTIQVKSDLYTNRDVYLCFRTPTTVGSSGPFLRVGRVMQVSGRTSVQFSRKVLYERNNNASGVNAISGAPVASENLSYVPIGGIGGDRQEPSGEPAPIGGYQILA